MRRGARGRAIVAIGAALLVSVGLFVLPMAVVLTQAASKGMAAWLAAIADPDALAAIRLTLLTVAIALPANALFGIAAAWGLARLRFPGRDLLIALIDVPFAVSPVIAGMLFVLLFGAQGWFGPWLAAHDLRIVFATPGVVLATTFVTVPFVAREVLPLLEDEGLEEEEAARLLGAGGWQTFRRVVLPRIRWGVWFGAVLCAARAMGEFGAVSVVSGHIRGETNTVPLHVEVLYNEYRLAEAFAVASLLLGIAVLTLGLRWFLERRARRETA